MKKTFLIGAGLVAATVGLSLLAWFGGTGKIALPFSRQAVPAPAPGTRASSGFLASLGLGKQPPAQTNLPAASPDILYLTQPVTKLFGRITKVEGNTLSLTQRFSLAANAGTKDLTFTLTVTPRTKIVRLASYIPYLFKTVPPQPDEVLSLKELVPGMVAAVTTNADLRLSSQESVEATSVEVTRVSNTITGTVTGIQGNSLTIKAPPPTLPAAIPATTPPVKEHIYTVAVTPQTEISRSGKALSLSDVAPGQTVTVWTGADVAMDTAVTALRLEPGL